MKVFIDTNILLDIYQLSGPDLEELRKLIKLVGKGKIDLLLTQQVLDEFWRNRERVIADAMKSFRESKAMAKIPNIIRSYPEAIDLKKAVDQVNEIVKILTGKATQEIEENALKADEVIGELFDAVKVGDISPEIVARANLRTALGNPPGKPGSIGDAVNWEWLLEFEIDFADDELVLISADGDYESELLKGRPKEFLVREWNAKHADCQLILDKSLTDFLKRAFPDIQLADEVDKIEAIELLEQAGSFAATHNAVANLSEYDDFKDSEVQRIVKAYLENNQVRWILGDDDVKAFGKKIVSVIKTAEAKELAVGLVGLLDQLPDDDDPF